MSSLDSRFQARYKGTRKKSGIVAGLDLGATKIICMIGKRDGGSSNKFDLLGVGQQVSRGLKNGAVVDMDGLERAIRRAVEDAERQAQTTISEVALSIGGTLLDTRQVIGECAVDGEEVCQEHIDKALEAAIAKFNLKGRELLHAIPVDFIIDGNGGVIDPRGMFADTLGVCVNMVSAPLPPYKNLLLCLSRAHLNVARVEAAPVVSAYSVLVDDELENGAVCIDLGGGTTSVSVFENKSLVSLDTIPIGGAHVTGDLAQGLGTTIAAADKLKMLHASVLRTHSDETHLYEAPRIGDDGRLTADRVSKKEITDIIEPRVEEIFELVAKSLRARRSTNYMPKRAILTGGGSDLPGIRELASRVLGMQVRLGKPQQSAFIGETYAAPGFSTALGLLDMKNDEQFDAVRAGMVARKSGTSSEGKILTNAVRWLRENF